MTEVLRFARTQTYAVASNVRGDDAASWAFLLPSLAVDRAVIVGRRRREISRAARALPIAADVVTSVTPDLETANIVVATPDVVRSLLRSPEALAVLRRSLARGAVVVLEPSRHTLGVARRLMPGCPTVVLAPVPNEAAQTVRCECAAWIIPRDPAASQSRTRRAIRRLTHRTVLPTRLLAVAPADAEEPVAQLSRAAAVLRADAHEPATLPDYVRETAARGSHVLASSRWVLEPSRGYRSQKVVFHLPDADEIVKVTQAPDFNGRLLNEYRALVELDGRAPQGLAPRPLFVGEHAGLLLVGETRLHGEPFRRASTGEPTCEVASGVVDALTELARLAGGTCAGADAAAALTELLEHHVHLNNASAAARGSLLLAIERIGREPHLPIAFTHGDPTTLNILVDEGGGIGLVDWENSEPRGLPLWDLLHFVHAYSQWGAERRGTRWTADLMWSTLYGHSEFAAFLQRSIDRYSYGTELPSDLVGPLIRTFWMGLAIREATRRRQRGPAGPYARLLEDAADRGLPGGPNQETSSSPRTGAT